MRLVIALGGNALLRRGEAMTAENQRENVRIACQQIAKVAPGKELVIAHGNGPQVGLCWPCRVTPMMRLTLTHWTYSAQRPKA